MFKSEKTNRYVIIGTAIVATLLLLGANFSFFYSHYIYNSDRFAVIATRAFQSEEVRTMIASELLNEVLEGKPILRQLAGGAIESGISGMLESPLVGSVFQESIGVIHRVLVSKVVEDVVISLVSLKEFITPLLTAVSEQLGEESRLSAVDIPDEVVILKGSRLPQFVRFNSFVLWAGPVAGILAVATYALLYFLFVKLRGLTLTSIGLSITIGSVILIILTWMFNPAVTSSYSDANVRILVGSVYHEFSIVFIVQTFFLFIVGGLITFWGKSFKHRMPPKTKKE